MIKQLCSGAILVLFMILGGCASQGVPPGPSRDTVNIVIVGNDSAGSTLPRNSSVMQRVINGAGGQLADAGFNVIDDSVLGLPRGRAGQDDLIGAARSLRTPPLDVIVMVAMHSRIRDRDYARQLSVRLEGEMLDISNGKNLGSFEISGPRTWRVPPDCTNRCVQGRLGDHAMVLANDLGAILSERLGWLVGGGNALPRMERDAVGAFSINFDGFTPNELFEVEDELSSLTGFKQIRAVYGGEKRAEYSYETELDAARLHRNVRAILDELQHRAVVRFAGSTFDVEKLQRRTQSPKVDDKYEW